MKSFFWLIHKVLIYYCSFLRTSCIAPSRCLWASPIWASFVILISNIEDVRIQTTFWEILKIESMFMLFSHFSIFHSLIYFSLRFTFSLKSFISIFLFLISHFHFSFFLSLSFIQSWLQLWECHVYIQLSTALDQI